MNIGTSWLLKLSEYRPKMYTILPFVFFVHKSLWGRRIFTHSHLDIYIDSIAYVE